MLAGFLALVAAVFGGTTGAVILGISLGSTVVIPVAYSYLDSRKLNFQSL